MSEFQLTSSVSQAVEIAAALIQNRVREWFDTRYDMFGHCFYTTWGRCGGKKTEHFFLKRLEAFAATLGGMRITKIVTISMPVQKDECDDIGLMERTVQFHLGTEKEPSRAIVEVVLAQEDERLRELWGAWCPSYYRALVCIKHPNKKYRHYVLLGIDALPD